MHAIVAEWPREYTGLLDADLCLSDRHAGAGAMFGSQNGPYPREHEVNQQPNVIRPKER